MMSVMSTTVRGVNSGDDSDLRWLYVECGGEAVMCLDVSGSGGAS